MRCISIVFIFVMFYSTQGDNININERINKASLQRRISHYVEEILEHLREMIPTKFGFKPTFKDYTHLTPTMIIKALENLREVLPERISIFPFAMAEPTIDNILVYFAIHDSSLVNLTRYIANASVSHTGGHSVTVNINLVSDTSALQGHYELDISNYDMHLYGDGNYSITTNITNVSISITIQVHEDRSFLMTSFLVHLSINSSKIELDNLLDGDQSVEPIVAFLGQMLPSELDTLSSLLQDTVNSTVINFTNTVIAKIFTWDDIVLLIKFAAGDDIKMTFKL